MTGDINNYLNNPLKIYEYVRLILVDIPEDVIQEYKLKEKATSKGHVYLEVRKGMHDLPQAGLLAQELLEDRLEKHGYKQSKLIPGFWTRKLRPTQFPLVRNNFGVKFKKKSIQSI